MSRHSNLERAVRDAEARRVAFSARTARPHSYDHLAPGGPPPDFTIPSGGYLHRAIQCDIRSAYPFVMYRQRAEWKAKGQPAQLALKLAMNSIYGKLAQQKDGKRNAGTRTRTSAFRAGTRRTKKYARNRVAAQDERNRRGGYRDWPFNELVTVTGYDLYALNRIKEGLGKL